MTETSAVASATNGEVSTFEEDPNFWYGYINEVEAAEFYGVTPRKMQEMRQSGDGPRYFRFSARLIRYTRALLKSYADARVRKSTSDPGQEAA